MSELTEKETENGKEEKGKGGSWDKKKKKGEKKTENEVRSKKGEREVEPRRRQTKKSGRWLRVSVL